MKVIILGGNGYLGSKLGKRLSELGVTVYSVVRSGHKQDWAEETWSYNQLAYRLSTYKIDWMINCIAKYERGDTTAREVLEANYVQPYCCFEQGIRNGIRKYMTMDTGLSAECNLYSRTKKQFADSIEWKLNEVFPSSDEYVFWNVKLENFYGSDESTDRFLLSTVYKLKKNERIMLTKGNQKRDFIHIDDVINNLVNILAISESGRVDLPLGTGEAVSIRDAVSYLKEITHSESELLFGAIPSRRVEPDSVADLYFMKKYGLKVQYNWKEGFRQLL